MKTQFNTRGNPSILSRQMNEEEVLEEYIDCLDTFVSATRGNKATNLTKKDFYSFYSMLSLLIGEDEDDKFISLMHSHYAHKNINTSPKVTLKSPSKMEDKKSYSGQPRRDQQESFNILKLGLDKMGKGANDKEVVVDPKKSLSKLSEKLAVRGSRGLLSFAKAFKKTDTQRNCKVDFDSFKELCNQFLLQGDDITNADIVSIFQMVDNKTSGFMN